MTGMHPQRLSFDMSSMPADLTLARVDAGARVITGLAVPWGVTGNNGAYRWIFERGSIVVPTEPEMRRVKILRDHMWSLAVGYVTGMVSDETGLWVTCRIARGQAGDEVLSLAEDGVIDGLSIGPSVDDVDHLIDLIMERSTDDPILVSADHPIRIAEVSLTPCPAFQDARVTTVQQHQNPTEGTHVMPPDITPETPSGPVTTLSRADVDTIIAGLTHDSTERIAGLGQSIVDAVQAIPVPTAGTALTAGAVVTEPPVYSLDGLGASYVLDAWKATRGTRAEQDAAVTRLRRYSEQTADWSAAAHRRLVSMASTADATTATEAEIIPPGYRPELYVGQLPQGRPLVDAVSRGSIANSTPFTIPAFVSATNMVDPSRLEGEAPDSGTLALTTVTVTPASKAGKFRLSREIVDAANPAVDMIVMNAMREDYARKTEQIVATLLETAAGTPDMDPTISTAGVWLHTTSGDGADFIDEVLDAMAQYWFRRFAAPDRLVLGRDGWTYSAGAKDLAGRHLLSRISPQNAVGTGGPVRASLDFDGLPARPAWALDVDEQDAYLFNAQDVWYWESPLLEFRFDEKSGPENVELAVFGYSAAQILRPSGITAVAYTPGS